MVSSFRHTNTLTRPDSDTTLHSRYLRVSFRTLTKNVSYIRLCWQMLFQHKIISFSRSLFSTSTVCSSDISLGRTYVALKYVRLNNWLAYEHNLSSLPGPNNGRLCCGLSSFGRDSRVEDLQLYNIGTADILVSETSTKTEMIASS